MSGGFFTGVLRVVAVAAVAGGLSGGIYLAVQAGRSSEPAPQAVAQATDTAVPTATAHPEPTETPSGQLVNGGAAEGTSTPVPTPPYPGPTPCPGACPTATFSPPPTLVPTVVGVRLISPGQTVQGGDTYQMGNLVFALPAGRSFRTGVSISDPGGVTLFFLVDLQTESVLRLYPDTGREEGRYVTSSDVDVIFDTISASIRLAK